MEFCYSYI